MKTTVIDRKTARTINDEAEEALREVAERFGLSLVRENGRFGPGNLTVKYSFKVLAGDGTGAPSDFARNARLLGLPEDCFGKSFYVRGKEYKVVGINLRARKYPVVAERVSDGTTFKMSTFSVRFTRAA